MHTLAAALWEKLVDSDVEVIEESDRRGIKARKKEEKVVDHSCCRNLLTLLETRPELLEQDVLLESLDALRMILCEDRPNPGCALLVRQSVAALTGLSWVFRYLEGEKTRLEPTDPEFVKNVYDAFTAMKTDGLDPNCQHKLVEYGVLQVCLETVTSDKEKNLDSSVLRLMMAVLCGESELVEAMFLKDLNESKHGKQHRYQISCTRSQLSPLFSLPFFEKLLLLLLQSCS